MNQVQERFSYKTQWVIRRYADQASFERGEASDVAGADGQVLPAESVIDGNLLLNEGIGELLDLLAGLGSPTAFNNANARIGVGDSSTAEAATQTGLSATTNKLYKAVDAGFPTRSSQTVTWQAQFTGAEANWAWNEFTVANGSSDAAKNLNRKVSAQGTKTSGQVWTISIQVTIS